MGETVYNKLVRDDIPEIIRNDGHVPVVRLLGDQERLPAALDKVVEEARELHESRGDLSEFADVAAIFEAAVKAAGYTMDQVEEAKRQKQSERGGFEDWVYLEKVVSREERA